MPALLISTSRWPKRVLDLRRRRPGGGRVGDVQGDGVRVAACRAQCRSGLLTAPRVSGADQDRYAPRSELLGSRTADPLIRPGNQRDLLVCGVLGYDRLLAMRWCVLLTGPGDTEADRTRSGRFFARCYERAPPWGITRRCT